MTTESTASSASDMWAEVAAERAGEPAAPAARPESVPAAPEPATEAKSVATKPDPLAAITAKLADFENRIGGRLRNVEGHIGNLHGTQKELKTLLEVSKTASRGVAHAPTQAAVQQAAANPAEWVRLKEDYPEWAVGVEKLFDARLGGAARSNDGFDPKAFEAALRSELRGQTEAVRKEIVDSSLEAVFPGWKETAKSEAFHAWVNGQAAEVKALVHSDRVGDAAKALKLFESHRQANPAAAITHQRKQVLAQATGTPPRSSSAQKVNKSWEDMTPAERWAVERTRRERTSR